MRNLDIAPPRIETHLTAEGLELHAMLNAASLPTEKLGLLAFPQ
jgi:hypothetical protein